MEVYVGVDGGGTKTRVMAIELERSRGVVIAGPPSNPNSVGWATTVERVTSLIVQSLAMLGATGGVVRALCAALAGVGRAEQAERMQRDLQQRLREAGVEVKEPIRVVADALAALTAGTRGGSGVVLVAGTGSICMGEDETGRVARSGGYGYLIGDEGSGFWIGREGILSAIQAVEGRGPRTSLWEAAAARFQVKAPGDLVSKIYEDAHPVGVVASFAQDVVAAAAADPVADAILARAVDCQAALVESVFTQLGAAAAPTVVLAGGLFTHSDGLRARLQARLPQRVIVRPSWSAAAGATLRAMLGGAAASEGLVGASKAELVKRWEAVVSRVDAEG